MRVIDFEQLMIQVIYLELWYCKGTKWGAKMENIVGG
jgi:hypothetical protein